MRAFPLILVAGALLVSSVFLMRSGGAADRPAAARDRSARVAPHSIALGRLLSALAASLRYGGC